MTPSPPIWHVRFTDSDQLVEGIRGAHLEPCQLSAAPAPSELARVTCGSACLDLALVGPAMHFTGIMPKEAYTMVFVQDCPQPGHSYNFAKTHGAGYLGFFAPGEMIDASTPAGYRNGTLTVAAGTFASDLFAECPEACRDLLHRSAALLPEPEEQMRLGDLLTDVNRLVLDPAQPLASPLARQALERSLRSTYVRALASGWRRGRLSAEPRVQQAHRRMREARDFLSARLHEPVYLADLCAALGLQRRAVEKLFHDFLGVSPMVYLRHLRLHGARRALLASPRHPGIIKQTALQWGFWHLGRFSADYHRFFGEPPARTLSR